MWSVEIRCHGVCGVSKDISVTGTVKISLRLCGLNFSGPSSLKAQDESVLTHNLGTADTSLYNLQQQLLFRHLGLCDGAGRTGKQLCIHSLNTSIL